MPQVTINNCAGLFVQQNSFTVPDGALERALNIICTQDQMGKSRRGIEEMSGIVVTKDGNAIVEYLDKFFVSEETQFSILADDFSSKTALSDPSSLWSITKGDKPRFAKANGNLFATTATGILKIESTSAAIRKAGIPKGLDLLITASTNSGILTPNSAVAYRIVFGRVDANSNKILGAPSELSTITNVLTSAKLWTNSTSTITVASVAHGLSMSDTIVISAAVNNALGIETNLDGTFTVSAVGDVDHFSYVATAAPSGSSGPSATLSWGVFKKPTLTSTIPVDALSTEYFYQIHRGSQSVTATTIPLEDLQLIYEANLTSTDVSNKYISFDDTVDDIFKGAFLYTNANTGEGIGQANDPPPFAELLCNFKEMMIYAATKTKYRLGIALISTNSLSGDSFKVTSNAVTRTYTGAAAENIGALQFLVSATGTTSQKIAATAKSLCRVINRDASSDVVAYYVSTIDGVPGKFVIESKRFDRNFIINCGTGAVSADFQPVLATSGSTVTGLNDDNPNIFFVSKPNQSEAVPLFNNLPVGPKTSGILRVVALRETALFLTESGVWGVRGTSPSNLTVQLIDSTVICRAVDSVVVLNNECYFISNQGIAASSETAVRIVSRQIEPLLNSVLGKTYFQQFTTAVGYESEHLYILGTIGLNADPKTMSEAPTTASISSLIATVNFSSTVTSVKPGDSVVITLMAGALTPLNGIFRVLTVSGSAITFYVNNANVGSASASSALIQQIAQNEVYCYNIASNRWSHWDTFFTDAITSSTTDRLIMIKSNGRIGAERKNFNNLDFTEQSYALTIGTVASDGLSTTATSAGTIVEGDVFVINSINYTVDSVVGSTYYFAKKVTFVNGATGTHYKYIEHDIISAPLTAGDVSRMKFYSEFQAIFRTKSCRKVNVSFLSNSTVESSAILWKSHTSVGWGKLPWGKFPWGLGAANNLVLTTVANENVRIVVPSSCARASWIKMRLHHKRAGEAFDLQSFSYKTRAYGSRVGS